jgi:hypothetical protein
LKRVRVGCPVDFLCVVLVAFRDVERNVVFFNFFLLRLLIARLIELLIFFVLLESLGLPANIISFDLQFVFN